VTVDARNTWWGDATGPSGDGPGAGDAVYADNGGVVLFDPWLVEPDAAHAAMCPVFDASFESGTPWEWIWVSP
jgi:hypothetical protein